MKDTTDDDTIKAFFAYGHADPVRVRGGARTRQSPGR